MQLFLPVLLLLFLFHGRTAFALDNGLALTPPMGWLQWERFACNTDCANDPNNCINENLFMQMADHLAADGFKDMGYQYVNIDDCWSSKERDANGKLQPDPQRFPHGIKYLADYVHSKGLKLGIYGDVGTYTCGGYPGSLDHLQDDANTYAEWGIDMLKMDGCHASESIYETGYPNMTMALNNTGRPIVFSCSWPAYVQKPNYAVIAKACNLWRNYDDISDSWDSVLGIINHYGDNQDEFQPYAGPGHWNDPDMLIIGNFGLSLEQQKVQMALWAIFAAPLLMSNDLRSLSEDSKSILLNREVIEVNQDPMGIQGRLITSYKWVDQDNHVVAGKNRLYSHVTTGTDRVYSRPLMNGDVAVALLNTNSFSSPRNITFSFREVGVNSNLTAIRDLFAMRDLGTFSDNFTASVDPTGVRLFRIKSQ